VATGWYCIEDEVEEMQYSLEYATLICDVSEEPCVERIEWSQEVAESNCPDGYGSGGDKGWESAKVCPVPIRLEDGFYERADTLYQASFNRSLANHIFWSCSAICVYDIENEGVVYQWKSGCWEMQTDWSCITVHTREYAWALNYISDRVCPIETETPAPTPFTCVEREQEWSPEIAQAICADDYMGSTVKGFDATVCAGYEDHQYRLDHSLANRVFLTCDAWCVYDIYKSGYEAFIWKNSDECWKPVTFGLCIEGYPAHREKMTDYIQNTLCESATPEPTEEPTCNPQVEWSESLMDDYCTVGQTGSTYKHYSDVDRAAVPCSGYEDHEDELLKSLAMRLFKVCSSWCVYDYYSNALLAWKWSSSGECWELQTWGGCHWDYTNLSNQPEWEFALDFVTLSCTLSPTMSPTGCMPYYTWDEDRAGELCPDMSSIVADKSFGVQACDTSMQDKLEKSLANNFYTQCSSWCVYDFDTVINNILTDSSEYGGFIWKNTCWKWVTDWHCFTDSAQEFEDVTLRAEEHCDAQN